MLNNVEPLDDMPEPLDRIRRCGRVDTEFFSFVEWLNEQHEADADAAAEFWTTKPPV
jgi:hypothetical protein